MKNKFSQMQQNKQCLVTIPLNQMQNGHNQQAVSSNKDYSAYSAVQMDQLN